MNSQVLAAIITALGSTVVGVSAVFYAWRSNRAMIHQQQAMADSERLWNKRSDVYVTLLGLLDEWNRHHPTVMDDGVTDAEREQWWAFTPKLDAFASELIRDKFYDWMFPHNRKLPEREQRNQVKMEIRELIRMELLQDLPSWFQANKDQFLPKEYRPSGHRPNWR